jgi:hypothetical protein
MHYLKVQIINDVEKNLIRVLKAIFKDRIKEDYLKTSLYEEAKLCNNFEHKTKTRNLIHNIIIKSHKINSNIFL